MNLYDLADIPNTHLHGPATEREAAAVSAKTRVRNAEIIDPLNPFDDAAA